jgi:hypothetical protein
MLSLALFQALPSDLHKFSRGMQYLCLIRGIVTGKLCQLREVPITVAGPLTGGVIEDSAVVIGDCPQVVEESFAGVFVHGLEGCSHGRERFLGRVWQRRFSPGREIQPAGRVCCCIEGGREPLGFGSLRLKGLSPTRSPFDQGVDLLGVNGGIHM